MEIRISGAQISVTRDIESNIKAIDRAIDYAISQKSEILLTPEGSLSGYTHEFDTQATEEALDSLTHKAKEAGLMKFGRGGGGGGGGGNTQAPP